MTWAKFSIELVNQAKSADYNSILRKNSIVIQMFLAAELSVNLNAWLSKECQPDISPAGILRWREQLPSAYYQWKALVAQETMVSAPMTVVMMVQMALMMTRQWSLVILPIVM